MKTLTKFEKHLNFTEILEKCQFRKEIHYL